MNKMLDLVCQINNIVDGIKPVKNETKPMYAVENSHICPMCEGEGFIKDDYVCPNCKGEGYVYTKICINEGEVRMQKAKQTKVNFVNQEIRKAIVNTTQKSIGVNYKQVIAILDLYVRVTGEYVTTEQINFLHKITSAQAVNIIKMLNKLNKHNK